MVEAAGGGVVETAGLERKSRGGIRRVEERVGRIDGLRREDIRDGVERIEGVR